MAGKRRREYVGRYLIVYVPKLGMAQNKKCGQPNIDCICMGAGFAVLYFINKQRIDTWWSLTAMVEEERTKPVVALLVAGWLSVSANLLPMAILAFSAMRYRCSFSIARCSCLLSSSKAAFRSWKITNQPTFYYGIVGSILLYIPKAKAETSIS